MTDKTKTDNARALMQKTTDDLTQRIVDGGARSLAARSVRAAKAGVSPKKLAGAFATIRTCIDEAEAALNRYLENPQEEPADDTPRRFEF